MEDDSDYSGEEEDRACTISTPSTLTAKSSIYRGYKGSFHHSHENPRAIKPKDFYSDFAKLVCGGDHNKAHKLIDDFNEQNDKVCHYSFTSSLPILISSLFTVSKNTLEGKYLANGMLLVFYDLGARSRLLCGLFHIGKERYEKAINGVEDLPSGGVNVQAVSDEMSDQLMRMKESLPTEEGYPCGHRRLQIYITDESLRTWSKLYENYYLSFECMLPIRKMGFITFYNHMRAKHPDFRLRRLQEDACDSCVELKTGVSYVLLTFYVFYDFIIHFT